MVILITLYSSHGSVRLLENNTARVSIDILDFAYRLRIKKYGTNPASK